MTKNREHKLTPILGICMYILLVVTFVLAITGYTAKYTGGGTVILIGIIGLLNGRRISGNRWRKMKVVEYNYDDNPFSWLFGVFVNIAIILGGFYIMLN